MLEYGTFQALRPLFVADSDIGEGSSSEAYFQVGGDE
jgi:hypothetical protein